MDLTKHSKMLSFVLRHKPDDIGITLGEGGWISTNELIDALVKHGHHITMDILIQVVENNDKKRFSFNDDKTMIRAAQGHSVGVQLDYKQKTPPAILYHGTVDKYLTSIKQTGLDKGKRHAVHLSKDKDTATTVGSRRGEPVILIVNAKQMHDDGYKFFQSDNGVWLTDFVLPRYIEFPR